jgi:hypothetical protein
MSTRPTRACVKTDPTDKDVSAPAVHVFWDCDDGWWKDKLCFYAKMDIDHFVIVRNEVMLILTPEVVLALMQAMDDESVRSFKKYLTEWDALPEDEKQRRRDESFEAG